MAWDASRPVPWRRLVREWAISAGLLAILLLIFVGGTSPVGIVIGLLASGPVYLLFGYVMAKFGYQRQTIREARANARTMRELKQEATAPVARRPKPAPTRRTGGGTPAKRRR